ncbi:MAG TPA: MraY family glycosyltransferase [Bacteroidales bacterium]|nr:MraY family glycosyltransferase [Bacteroidales bacterium]
MFTSQKYFILLYSIFFAVTLFFAILINNLLLKFSKTLGIRDKELLQARWASTTKPSIGGVSFYICFLLSIIAYPYFIDTKILLCNFQFLGIIWAATLAFIMGLFDDAFNTNVWVKLFSQIGCTIILIVTGTIIKIFNSDYLNYLITIIWVVGMMNSINMLDNMDAITTIIAIPIILTIIITLMIFSGMDNPYLFALIGLLSTLIGFLFFNWHPAKMYMGDTGSQFLGFILAFIGITFFWNFKTETGITTIAQKFISVALAFALPLIDTTTVFIKRINKGKSPFIGGRDHTTHHLFYVGLSEKQIALLYGIITIIYSFLSITVLYFIPVWYFIHAIVFSLFFILLFVILFYIANKNINKE